MSIQSHKTTWPKFLLLFVVSIIGMSVIHQEVETLSASASEETLLTSFSSNSLVTASTYQSYQDDDWLLTVGGNNNGVGASNTYASKLVLGNYVNLMNFDSNITRNSTYLTAVITKKPFRHLSNISISRGASNYAYLSTKAYLVKSSTLDGDYQLVTTIDSITTSLVDYSFPTINDNYYYAFVFYNPTGAFLLGDVIIHFYSQIPSANYHKVTSNTHLYLGGTYTFVSETNNLAISNELTPLGFGSTSISISENMFESPINLLTVILEVGTLINTYSLRLNNLEEVPSYLALDVNNHLATSETLNDLSSFSLSFNNDLLISESSNGLGLVFDNDATYIFSTQLSNISLYRLEEEVDYQLEASYFVNTLLSYSDAANGRCESIYLYLDNLYQRLSDNARSIILSSEDPNYLLARSRMNYLSSWVSRNTTSKTFSYQHSTNQTPFFVIIFLFSSTITLYYFHKRKLIEK